MTTCGVCTDPSGRVLYSSAEGTSYRCRQCGLAYFVSARAAGLDHVDYTDDDLFQLFLDARRDAVIDRRYATALDRLAAMSGLDTRADPVLLYDIGAGSGEFLSLARDRGFAVAGNELAPSAVTVAHERYGVDLDLGALSEPAVAARLEQNPVDVVTMWCVLAHVPDPRGLLESIHRILKPGGILYLQTPRWCAIDALGLGATRMTKGKASRITRRRINLNHQVLFNRANLRRLLAETGFDRTSITAQATYSLTTSCYLESMGAPPLVQRAASVTLDPLVDRGLFPRNVLDVYARSANSA